MAVARFLLRRLTLGLVVMWTVATIVFTMYFVAPHDVARLLAGRQATPETVTAVSRKLGLDRPILSQYESFLGRLIHGNLGYSYTNSEPVTRLIGASLPITVALALGGAVLWLLIGVTVGVMAATRRRTVFDRVSTVVALVFYSTPIFLLGELLLILLFYRLHLVGIHLFPGGGYVALTHDPVAWAQHLLLPWLTIALVSAATYERLTRAALLEVLGEDYIRTATAKGVSARAVTVRHGLRAALTPIITQFGLDLGTLLGGVVVTETVFGLPGLGQLLIISIQNQDLPTTIGLVLLASAFVVIANIIVDLVYVVIDPRVRLS